MGSLDVAIHDTAIPSSSFEVRLEPQTFVFFALFFADGLDGATNAVALSLSDVIEIKRICPVGICSEAGV